MSSHTTRRGLLGVVAAAVLLPGAAVAAKPAPQKLVILMLGAPGSGKTTQAERLSRKYKIPAFSMATIFRKESGWVKDRYKKSLRLPMATGDVLGDELANQLVEKHIRTKKAQNGFILDGYPRTAKQAEYFERTLSELGLPEPIVIHLDVPEEVAARRLLDRGKRQDKPEMIEARMAEYRAEAEFLMRHYRGRVRRVDGAGSRDEVWRRVQQAVEEFLR